MADKIKVVYTGSFPTVTVLGIDARRGEPVSVPPNIAAALCKQKYWEEYQDPQRAKRKPAKPKKEES